MLASVLEASRRRIYVVNVLQIMCSLNKQEEMGVETGERWLILQNHVLRLIEDGVGADVNKNQ